ncbi:MAG: hypothetical protein M9944_08895 [Rhizobiaceae bacterium]|nr:hypothetical protein [Rhizobiaceae bacterium]
MADILPVLSVVFSAGGKFDQIAEENRGIASLVRKSVREKQVWPVNASAIFGL